MKSMMMVLAVALFAYSDISHAGGEPAPVTKRPNGNFCVIKKGKDATEVKDQAEAVGKAHCSKLKKTYQIMDLNIDYKEPGEAANMGTSMASRGLASGVGAIAGDGLAGEAANVATGAAAGAARGAMTSFEATLEFICQ